MSVKLSRATKNFSDPAVARTTSFFLPVLRCNNSSVGGGQWSLGFEERSQFGFGTTLLSVGWKWANKV